MPHKVLFRVIHLSSQDENFRGSELNAHCPTAKGWQSQRFCTYPQDIVIQLDKRTRIKKIQFLSHQFLIATKIEFFVGDVASIQSVENIKLSDARFSRLGYVALSNNEKTGFRARELKSVHVDAIGCFIKFIIHKNHINRHNQYNQVGLVAVNIIGDELLQQEDATVVNTTGESTNKYVAPAFDRSDQISAMDDLAFDMYLDPDVAQVIRKLESKKHDAVSQECYDLAKKIKTTIEQLQVVGEKLGKAEVEKRQAIDNEDYDKAKLKKQQMDNYRLQAYEKLRVADILSASLFLPHSLQDIGEADVVHLLASPRAITGAGDGVLADTQPTVEPLGDVGSPLRLKPSPRQQSPPESQRIVPYDERPLPTIRSKMQFRHYMLTSRQSPTTISEATTYRDDYTFRTARGDDVPGTPDITTTDQLPQGNLEAEEMSEKDLREAGPLIDAFDIDVARKIYSKHWSLREEALESIHRAMAELDPSAGKDEAILLMRGALIAINKAIKDNVFAVFSSGLNLHSMIVAEFISRQKISRSETASFLEKTIPNLLLKTGDTSIRHRDAAKALIIEESSLPEVKSTNTLVNECLRPFKLSTAPRLALSRTDIVDVIYAKHGLRDGPDSGGPTLNSLLLFLTNGALRHTAGEVRDKAERLIVTLYEHHGMPVRDFLLNSDEKTRKSLIYKQLFKAFGRIDQLKRGTVGGDEDDFETSHHNTSGGRIDGGDARENKPPANKVQERRSQVPDANVGQQRQQKPSRTDTKNKNNRSSLRGTPTQNVDENENERVCIFCGEANDAFNDDGLDIHYWKSCPVLLRCSHCQQVVEISSLTEHLLEECTSHDNFSQCPRCTEAIHVKLFDKHIEDNSCPPSAPGKSRCPLCHMNIVSSEESWRNHLMSEKGCRQNTRRQQLQSQAQTKSESPANKSTKAVASTNAEKRNLPSAKVKVR